MFGLVKKRLPSLLKDKVFLGIGFASVLILLNASMESIKRPDWKDISWQRALGLEQPLANSSLVAHDNTIFVIGGGLSPAAPDLDLTPVRSVYFAQTQANGSLGAWKEGPELPQRLAYQAIVATKKGVFVIGGFNGESISPYTYYAPFKKLDDSTFTLADWVTSTVELRDGRGLSTHSAILYNDKIYLIGGFSQAAPSSKVYSTTISETGEIASWQIVDTNTSLPPIYRHSSVVYEHKIYVIGGRDENDFSKKTVYVADIESDGGLNGWMLLPTELELPESLYFSSAIVSNDEGKIYVLGGFHRTADTKMELDTIFSSKVLSNGGLTPWEQEYLSLPQPIFRHSAISPKNGGIYLIGGKTNGAHLNSVHYIPPLTISKSSVPSGPIHEGDVITYSISYANTSLITQTVTITDIYPSNATLLPETVSPPAAITEPVLVWPERDLAPGETGELTFQMHVPLLPPAQLAASAARPLRTEGPDYVLPVPVACDTTQFWAAGVTRQGLEPERHTLYVTIPPGADPSMMWLLMKGVDNAAPTVNGQVAQLVVSSTNSFSASLWSAHFTPTSVNDRKEVVVTTENPRKLNALFFFKEGDPPFVQELLHDFQETTHTTSFQVELPSVAPKTMDVILPIMDITYWTDSLEPDTRVTTATVRFKQDNHTVVVNQPNVGNGLVMTKFPLEIGPVSNAATSTEWLTVTVETEDSVYTLGPRICRPVRLDNKALFCSTQAGCISDTVANAPIAPSVYLPLIRKNS
jgi:uncharacterized repeat protein (TIGR01451 family)